MLDGVWISDARSQIVLMEPVCNAVVEEYKTKTLHEEANRSIGKQCMVPMWLRSQDLSAAESLKCLLQPFLCFNIWSSGSNCGHSRAASDSMPIMPRDSVMHRGKKQLLINKQ